MSNHKNLVALMQYGRNNKGFTLDPNPLIEGHRVRCMVPGDVGREDCELSTVERAMRIVDDAMVADEFRWFEEKGITAQLWDAELWLDETKETITKALEEYDEREKLVFDDSSYQNFNNWAKWLNNLEEQVEDKEKELDLSMKLPEQSEGEGQALYSHLEYYIDKFTMGDLACILDVLEDKHIKGEIGWRVYIKCGLSVCARLKYNCPKGDWNDQYEFFVRSNKQYHTVCPAYNDRICSSMSLDMEAAIDLKRRAEKLAKLNGVSFKEMFYILMEEYEANASGMPVEIGTSTEEEWDDFILDQEYEAQYEVEEN